MHGESDAHPEAFKYDALDRLTRIRHSDHSDNRPDEVRYDYDGAKVTMTDEEGHVTVQGWAAFGAPSDARLLSLKDAEQQTWTYEYNALGSLTKVNQPAAPAREWHYNAHNQLEWEKHPESGTTRYEYDEVGNLSKKTDANGREFNYRYDGNDRVRLIDAPGENYDVTITYEELANRKTISNSFVTSNFEYDDVNRLELRRELIGSASSVTAYGYDGRGNVTAVKYPSGRVVEYQVDSANRVVKVSEPGDAGQVFAQNVTYHASGMLKSFTYGNGLTETSEPDERGRIKTIASGPLSLGYTYDRSGNVKTVNDPRPGLGQSFTYDYINRLKTVTGLGATSFEYYPNGNRQVKAAPEATYTYNQVTQRLESVSGLTMNPEVGSYAHDAVGNLLGDPSGVYTYTPFDMLETAHVGSATTTYRYDGENLRALKLGADSVRRYSHGRAGEVLSEFRVDGAELIWSRDYIYLGSQLLASVGVPDSAITVRLDAAASRVREASGSVPVRVVLSTPAPLTTAVSVAYATAPGTATAGADYQAVSGTVTFPVGSISGASETLSIPVVADQIAENDETFRVILTGPAGGAMLGAPAAQTVTIAGVLIVSLTANVTFPVRAGTPITWTAQTAGGMAPEYQWWFYDQATGWRIVEPYGSATTFTWMPADTDAGTHAVQVWVRETGSNAPWEGYAGGGFFEIANEYPAVVSLTPSRTLPQPVGTAVTWTAVAVGGRPPLQYQFWRYSQTTGQWTIVRPYGPDNHYTWTPAAGEAGTYSIQVWVRNAGSAAAYDAWLGTGYYIVGAARPLTVIALTTSSPLPAVGMAITWRVRTDGGSGPFSYKFYRYVAATSTWLVQRDWGPEASATWTPSAADQGPASSAVQVWVRNAESTAAYDAYVGSGVFAVAPARPLTVALTANRPASAVGMETTWTALTDGGTGPLEYRFWRTPAGGGWTLVRDWLPSPSVTWLPVPGDVGEANLQVWVRPVGSTAAYEAVGYGATTVAPTRPLSVTTLTSDVPPEQFAVGQPVTWTATTDGGAGPLEYQFYQYRSDTATWTLVQGYGPSPSYTWIPPAEAVGYQTTLQVWVRHAASTSPYEAWLGTDLFTFTVR